MYVKAVNYIKIYKLYDLIYFKHMITLYYRITCNVR